MARSLSFGAALLVASLVGGCVPTTATPYQSDGLMGGYGEQQINGNTWRIHFYGNSYADFETLEASWLRRIAELTLAHGFDGFAIVSKAEFNGDHGSKAVEGIVEMRNGPIAPLAHKRFDARAVIADVGQMLGDRRCQYENVCADAWDKSMANGLFTRVLLLNLSGVPIKVADLRDDEEHDGAAELLYPDEDSGWRLTITSKACSFVYEMPRDLSDAPWRADHPSNTRVPIQVASDMSLHVVPSHPGAWTADAIKLVAKDWGAPIRPTSTCN